MRHPSERRRQREDSGPGSHGDFLILILCLGWAFAVGWLLLEVFAHLGMR